MSTLPTGFAHLILAFAPVFSKRVFQSVPGLLIGAILATGKRTVTAVLRVMGWDQQTHFQTYHRVLNRAVWSSLAASRVLLSLLVHTFAPEGPLILGLDDTIERRWSAQIAARGIYRDPVRSSQSHFVKTSGLRWLCLMLLVPIPWAARVWMLPFFDGIVPVRALSRAAGQAAQDTHRLGAARRQATIITRLRLDAALYAPLPRRPGLRGRTPVKGKRLPALRDVLADAATQWTTLTIPYWYGEHNRQVDVASATAVWYRNGSPPNGNGRTRPSRAPRLACNLAFIGSVEILHCRSSLWRSGRPLSNGRRNNSPGQHEESQGDSG